MMFKSMWLPADPAPGVRPAPSDHLDCGNHCSYSLGPGLTLHWILSPDFQTPQVKWWCFLTSTDSLKLHTSLPWRNSPLPRNTAKLMVDYVFKLHDIPAEITSDRGPQFTSQVWRLFCSALGAQVNLSSGYHPQTNGQTERLNQERESTLRYVTNHNPATWSSHLPWVEYAHNAHVSASTSFSPFAVSLGYQPPLFPEEEAELAVPYVQRHIRRCRCIWTRAREALHRAKIELN